MSKKQKIETGSLWYSSILGEILAFSSLGLSILLFATSCVFIIHNIVFIDVDRGRFMGIQNVNNDIKLLLQEGNYNSYLIKDPIDSLDFKDLKDEFVNVAYIEWQGRTFHFRELIEIQNDRGESLPKKAPYYYSYMNKCLILYFVSFLVIISSLIYSYLYFSNAVAFCDRLKNKRNSFFLKLNKRINAKLRTYQEVQGRYKGWHYGVFVKVLNAEYQMELTFSFCDVKRDDKWESSFVVNSIKLKSRDGIKLLTDSILQKAALPHEKKCALEETKGAWLYVNSALDEIDEVIKIGGLIK